MKHRCKDMERAETIQSVRGQGAYQYYSLWMKGNNRKVPTIETFTGSAFFTSFVKFYDYVNKLRIPSPEKYIALMNKKKFQPSLWCRDECYSMYLEWTDRCSDPMDQAQITVNTLFKITDSAGVPITEVFSVLHPREVTELIRLRKMSPWLLLCSAQFKTFLNGMDELDKQEMMAVVGFGYWADKFQKNPEIVGNMRKIAEAMQI